MTAPAPPVAAPQWVMTLPKLPPAQLEQLRARLNQLPGTTATYSRMGPNEVELNLATTQAEPAIRLAVGQGVAVRLSAYDAPVVPLEQPATRWGEPPGQPPERERPNWFPSFW